MTRQEQEQRRQLKRERRDLDRLVSSGCHRSPTMAGLPTRWSYMRRVGTIGRVVDQNHRAIVTRIADIQRQLCEAPPCA